MAYNAQKAKAPDSSVLRATIPGWGVDLDPATRPAAKKEQFNPELTGAHWDVPEQQIATFPREMSTEHREITPVFGTACPPKGLSGIIRRAAYRLWSEGQTLHWLALVLADRVDVLESLVVDLFRGKPDNFLAEWGLRAEIRRHGFKSRFGRHRADTWRVPLDVMMLASTSLLTLGAGYVMVKGVKSLLAPPKRRWLFA